MPPFSFLQRPLRRLKAISDRDAAFAGGPRFDQVPRRDACEQGGPIRSPAGPRRTCMCEIRAGERGVIATLQLDDGFADDLGGCPAAAVTNDQETGA